MIKKIIHIDQIISKSRFNKTVFKQINICISTNSKKKLQKAVEILEEDKITFTIRKVNLFKWKILIQIPSIGIFDELEYQRIVGKFFIFSSRFYLNLETIGILD